MASPKKYKTNTAKKSSTKSGVSSKNTTKKPTSRVGATKLAKRSFFKAWMAVPVVLLVAIVGYLVVQFSNASGFNTLQANGCISRPKDGGSRAYECATGKAVTYELNITSNSKYRVCADVVASKGATWRFNVNRFNSSHNLVSTRHSSTKTMSGKNAGKGYYKMSSCSDTYSYAKGDTAYTDLTVFNAGKSGKLYVYSMWPEKRGSASSNAAVSDPKCGKQDDHQKKDIATSDGKYIVTWQRNHYIDCKNGRRTGYHWTKWFKVRTVQSSTYGKNEPKYGYAKSYNCGSGGYHKVHKDYNGASKYRCERRVVTINSKHPVDFKCNKSDIFSRVDIGKDWYVCKNKYR